MSDVATCWITDERVGRVIIDIRGIEDWEFLHFTVRFDVSSNKATYDSFVSESFFVFLF